MRMIERADITPGMMAYSNVPENDAPDWSATTTYQQGDRVIYEHRVYESVQGANAGHTPGAPDSLTWWLDTGATNRWRAFDGTLSPSTTMPDEVVYRITMTGRMDAVAVFGLIGSSISVVVKDGSGAIVSQSDRPLMTTRTITGWWDYFFAPFSVNPSVVFWDLPLFTGYSVEITILGATASVAEIIIGKTIYLGETLTETTMGFRDFSIKERDAWGGWSVVQRGYSRAIDFRFSLPQEDVSRVFAAVTKNRAKMAVFDSGPNAGIVPLTVLGFINEDGISIPITTNICFATLSVEGITEEF